jgi:hypothetical protein
MASLNTFGAIMGYAIELEARLRDFYQGTGNDKRAADADKRRTNLERVRRENVTEIKLEPIEGLSDQDYVIDYTDHSDEGQFAAEQNAARFYSDTAPKINVREVQRVFERHAKQHAELGGLNQG